jgi:hypothetical protein
MQRGADWKLKKNSDKEIKTTVAVLKYNLMVID